MTQPNKVKPWATDATYDASAEAWSLQPTKDEPSNATAEQGFVPNSLLAAEELNYLFHNLAENLDALADLPALSWGEVRVDGASTPILFPSTTGAIVCSSFDAVGRPRLIAINSWDINSATVFSSRDGWAWTSATTAPPSFTVGELVSLVSNRNMNGPRAMIVGTSGGNTIRAWQSADGGVVWTGPSTITSGAANASGKGHITVGGLYIVFGGSVLFTSTNGTAWTSRSTAAFATPTLAPLFIASPELGESGIGVIAGVSDGRLRWSLDGITWSEQSFVAGLALVAGCWSEAHKSWFVLAVDGRLWRRDSLGAGAWTLVTTFVSANATSDPFLSKGNGVSGISYMGASECSLMPFGRNLVILGKDASALAASPAVSGLMLVYNPATGRGHAISPGFSSIGGSGSAEWQRLVKHDSRLMAFRSRTHTADTWLESIATQRVLGL
jgi:hypothetical protein